MSNRLSSVSCLLIFCFAILQPQSQKAKLESYIDYIPHPTSVSDFKQIQHLSSENQDSTLVCWSFATSSFIESEMERLGLPPVRLSVMYPVYCVFLEKAKQFVKTRGESRFAPGDLFSGVIDITRRYGSIPASSYEGEKNSGTIYSHKALYRELDTLMSLIKRTQVWDEDSVLARVKEVLHKHLGVPPLEFTYAGKTYTPKSFVQQVVRLPWDEYIIVTSFQYALFYQYIELKVPDNWRHNANYFNVPLNLFYKSLKEAITKGYSIAIDADISEPSYLQTKRFAIIPTYKIPTDSLTQHRREIMFQSGETTDDHLMHIVSYRKFGKENWFLVKDSWRTAWEGPNKGYMFFHDSYIKMKVLAFLAHKNALPEIVSHLPK